MRAGFTWSPQLDAVLQDAKRGARRAIGDATRRLRFYLHGGQAWQGISVQTHARM